MADQAVILIVDDSSAGRDTLEALLIPEKHRLIFASNGLEAIRMASDTAPDLILLDVMMPGMDGYETCRRLRSDPRLSEVPIIMVTALDDRASRLQGIQSGADDFITKPFDRAELRARVRTITRLNRYRNLWAERSRFENLIELSPDGVIIVDRNGTIQLANPKALAMFGAPDEKSLTNRIVFDRIVDDSDRSFYLNLNELLAGSSVTFRLETTFLRPDGSRLPVEVHAGLLDWNNQTQVQIIAHDITERKKLEERLIYLAMYDSLTGLPNLNLLQDRLERTLALARRNHTLVGLIHVDIDGFHSINETLGRQAGNSILEEIALRFADAFRESDTLARVSTDEFVVVCNGLKTEEGIQKITDKLRDLFQDRPFHIQEHSIYLSACVGVCIFPMDGDNSSDLLKNATVALSFAKESGKGSIQRFETVMNGLALEHLRRTYQLRQAIDQNEFVLFYQPQIELANMQPVGLEALIRWQHPEAGLLQPSEFISLAEETGLIHQMGSWVIKEVCQQHLEWKRSGLPLLRIAINISPIQFEHSTLTEEIVQQIYQNGIDPNLVALEITETLFLRNQEQVSERLNQLRARGVRIDLDDFGTAYSSLSYLRKLPVDTLKIDRSFVCDLSNPASVEIDQAAFIKAIITLGHSLKLNVLAEGVETFEQLSALALMGCDQVQGYFFSHPIPPAQFSDWYHEHQAKMKILQSVTGNLVGAGEGRIFQR